MKPTLFMFSHLAITSPILQLARLRLGEVVSHYSLPSRVLTVRRAVAQVMCSRPGSRSESGLLGQGGGGAWVHPSQPPCSLCGFRLSCSPLSSTMTLKGVALLILLCLQVEVWSPGAARTLAAGCGGEVCMAVALK